MTVADKVTSMRLVLAPLFFIIYLLPNFFPAAFAVNGVSWTVPVLWILFIVSEITDMLDGIIARKRGEVSEFGKLYDPFADTLTQITFFFCFVIDGIFPPLLFLAVLYREFSILFVRNRMLKKGVVMGARMGGKIKTVTYIAAAALALFYSGLHRLNAAESLQPVFKIVVIAVFGVSVLFSVLSFFDYLHVYRKA